ncbi:MAG: hypothetical protein JWN98_1866 [Abditibacteriota bacterium]|nr:hypothetical protein [Abditibacteriota bacterium]
MNRIAYSLLLVGLLQLPYHADAYQYAARSPIEKLDLQFSLQSTVRTRQQYTVNTRSASTDDYLIELARTGDINVLADVTDIPAEASPLRVFGHYMLGQFITENLVKDRYLTMAHLDERNFLFWPSIDAKQLAQDIIARKATAPRQDPPPLDAEQTNALLKDYFQRVHGWDGNWENVDIKVPLADLPPELRARVDAELYGREISRLAYPRIARSTLHSGVLDPQSQFWKTALFTIAPGSHQDRGTAVPFLYLNRFRIGSSLVSGIPIGQLGFLDKK